jgi:hypothetical protein
MALIPTSGSRTVDQILLVLAEKLERHAALLEGQLRGDTDGSINPENHEPGSAA